MNSENHQDKEMVKKFNFVSKDRKESFEILIAELLVGELRNIPNFTRDDLKST